MKHTDQQIIEGIKKGGTEKETAAASLYASNKDFLSLIKYTKLVSDDGKREEAYNDAILDCVKKIEQYEFRQESKIRTFLSRIFHFKCIDSFRKIKKDKLIVGKIDPEIQGFIEPKIDFERIGLLEAIFRNCYKHKKKKICDGCKVVLFDWANEYSMKEISQRNKIANAKAAKVKKSRCLEMIRGIFNAGL